MLSVRTFCQNSRRLTNYISTSSVIKNDDSNKFIDPLSDLKKKDLATGSAEKKELKGLQKEKKAGRSLKKQVTEKQPVELIKDSFKQLLTNSAEKVAQDLKGNTTEIKKDLLSYIKTFEVSKEERKKFKLVPKRFLNEKRSINAFGEPPGQISEFKLDIMQKPQVKLNIWDDLETENLAYLTKQAPRNYFEELINWTNEGRLWHFPIDNDQGLEKEGEINFTEHVFLEQHLEPWCPKKGPLRRFMELVLIGLAKNPYISVEEKVEHIHWFEDYFEKKKKLLQELGAIGSAKKIDTSEEKS